MRKHISFIIILAMLLALLPGTALALDANTSWYTTNTTATEYTISDAADLLGLAQLVDDGNTFAGKTVTLANDIDLSGMTWDPISKFSGEFNGNGHTIKNIGQINKKTIEKTTYYGLFGIINGAGVHDLNIENVEATVGHGLFGALAGYVYDTSSDSIKNINIKNVTVTVSDKSRITRTGGLCGVTTESFENCSVTNFTVNIAKNNEKQWQDFFVGGFCGLFEGNNKEFKDCCVNGFNAAVDEVENQRVFLGGFIGYTQTNTSRLSCENCNVKNININVSEDTSYVGGFISCPGAKVSATNCNVDGKITMTGNDSVAGGFLALTGWGAKQTHTFSNCTTNVNIDANCKAIGGFIGYTGLVNNKYENTKEISCTNCTATGNVTGTGNANVGGFAGVADRGTYNNCTTSGTVSSAGGYAGGLIGEAVVNSNGLSITLLGNTNNTTEAKDIGNVANDVTINGLTADPSKLDFGTYNVGKDYSGKSKEVTLTENSSESLKVTLSGNKYFNVEWIEEAEPSADPSANPSAGVSTQNIDAPVEVPAEEIAANGTRRFKVTPVAGLAAGTYTDTIAIKDTSGTTLANVVATITINAPATPTSTGSGISLWYNGGNSFGSSKSAVPTSVEIDGTPVSFTGDGSNFTVSCVKANAKWITVRWNSTTVTANFTPDARAACAAVAIPKTGDMPIWAAIAEFFGF